MTNIVKLEADINKINLELQARIGAIKVDSNEQLRHPKLVGRLGEYADVCPLKSGDYAFNTTWDKVARIEYKTWDNLISDIGTRHVTDQLRKQLNEGLSILLLEGFISCTMGGMVKTNRREYHRPWWWLWNYLTSVQAAGTYIYFSPNDNTTPKLIISLFEYCQKPEHSSMGERQKYVSMHPTLTPHQRTFTAIPGVGDELAKAFDAKFKSLEGLCKASIDDLLQIEGLGKVKAHNVYNYIRGLI
jgi:ERCC4-type nuclease